MWTLPISPKGVKSGCSDIIRSVAGSHTDAM